MKRALIEFMVRNYDDVIFVVGFVAFCGGVGSMSVQAALILGGIILMGVAVWPHLDQKGPQ